MDYKEKSLALHREYKGKLALEVRVPLSTREDLSLAYTPGVAEVSRAIASDKASAYEYTGKGNAVAVVTDGSAVLGLGNIGPEAALPVMEGKAILFKKFADVDAYPICLATQDTEEIIMAVRHIAPGFGGINLEDISAPRCFEIEGRLQDLGIPVFHDDQHGTAIVVLAALVNASKVAGKDLSEMRVVIGGAGAAGTAIANLLSCAGEKEGVCMPVGDVVVLDRRGIVSRSREGLSPEKQALAERTNRGNLSGGAEEALRGADVFVGVSGPNTLDAALVATMAPKPVIFAMANPVPEIMPEEAKEAGAFIVATGRSDFPNQVNNVLAFPGVFRGALDARAPRVTSRMKLAAAAALAALVENPTTEEILPSPLDPRVAPAVAEAVKAAC